MKQKSMVAAVLLGCFTLLASLSTASAARITIINSYNMGYLWSQECLLGLVRGLGPEHALSVIDLDTKRVPPSAFQEQAERAWSRMIDERPDLVVLMDDNALGLLGPRLAQSQIKTVFLGINTNPRDVFGGTIPPTTWGVLERPLLLRSISMVSSLLPTARRVLILGDAAETSRYIFESALHGRPSTMVEGLTLDMKLTGSWEEWQTLVRSAFDKGYDALILGTHAVLRDAADTPIDSTVSLRWTSTNSPVPVFALWRYSVGPNMALGGFVLSGEDQGLAAAELIKALLVAKTAESARIVTPTKGRFVFSARQIERWNITLPPAIAENAEIGR